MDKDVVDFFNSNKDIEHNKDILSIPEQFLNINSDIEYIEFFKWIRYHSNAKSIRLDINESVLDLQEEIKSKVALAIPHRDHPMWRSITLYGYSSIMTNSYEYYKSIGLVTDDDLTDWTDISKFFPKTVSWLKRHCPLKAFSRIRIMILDPGGSSSPHKDYDKGQLICGPINIAIINPVGAEFVLEDGGTVPWKEGDVRSMDLGSIHCIRNTGTEPRAHIIITPSKDDWDIDAMKLACKSFIKYQREQNDARRT